MLARFCLGKHYPFCWVCCGHNTADQDFRLLTEEQAIAESFGSVNRRADFTTGSIFAHAALSKFGL
ncbi:hypothetical protein MK131_18225, partial [Candidatus Poribacteria bacterium]|nr:hypothetical protein [Candidatus Poribacteria bacterium]